MCGRYTLATPAEELVEAFDVVAPTFDWLPRYNVAPGQDAAVVAEDARGRRIGLLRWGFPPAWKDEPGTGFVNARAESVTTKPSFREAFSRRRCLVPVDGFYEWKRADGARQPFWIHPSGSGLLSFAGIWETWRRPGVEPRHGFAILTTDANAEVRRVHDRMPVVIPAEARARWLDRATPAAELARLLVPTPDGTFDLRPVSSRVNRTDEDDAGLIAPVTS
jgi:putative SOS response-associated peptidase YedK